MITRREFISRGAAAAGLLAAGITIGEAAEKRPNFLFILTDDQRYDAMGFMGHPSWLKTPNIDRIAREGAHFRNTFVTTSLCAPSRACFMTGAYAHRHGVVNNDGYDPDPSCPNVGQLLQKAGYETAYVGKWHQAPTSEPRPGFDYWLSFLGQGVYENPKLNENGKEFVAQGYMTDLLTDYAVKFLKKDREKPFCMVLAHKAVHGPFTPPDKYKDALPDAEIPEPTSYKDTMEDKPEWMRRAQTYGSRKEQWVASEGLPIPKKIDRKPWGGKGMLDYYRTILGIDDSVGMVLKTLEENGQLDDTVIMFAGDNGYFIGEHGLGDKRLMFEESLRIPFLMRYPKLLRAGSKVDQTVLNIDLAPTLLELAGARAPASMQGKSMIPAIKGKTTHESFFYEYFREDWLTGLPMMHGVRTSEWKYVTYPDIKDIDELYDLKNDPIEMHNLAQDPAHAARLAEMKALMMVLKKELAYPEGKQLGAPSLVVGAKIERVLGPVLYLDFSKGNANDFSGQQYRTDLHGGQFVDDGGKKVLKLEKGDYIDVAKSNALNPSVVPWTVEARIKAQSPNGVVMAQGGENNGYSLYLKDDVPHFAVRIEGALTEIVAKDSIGSGWVRLTAAITVEGAKLYVDGKLVASGKVGLLAVNPVEGLQIGRDMGSLVGSYNEANSFTGLMESVRIWAGEHKVE